jgi:hypothetical protein
MTVTVTAAADDESDVTAAGCGRRLLLRADRRVGPGDRDRRASLALRFVGLTGFFKAGHYFTLKLQSVIINHP